MSTDLLNNLLIQNQNNNNLYKDFLSKKSPVSNENPQNAQIPEQNKDAVLKEKTFIESYKENKKQAEIWQKELEKDGKVGDNWAGLAAGVFCFLGFRRLIGKIVMAPIHKKLDKCKLDLKKGQAIIDKIFRNNPNLKKNGFEYVFIGKNDFKNKLKVIRKAYKSFDKSEFGKIYKFIKIDKFVKNNIIGKQLMSFMDVVAKGKNAFYAYLGNIAVAGEKSMAYMLHEIGHAANSNKFKGAGLLINIARALPLFAFIAVAEIPYMHGTVISQELFKKSFIKGVDDNKKMSQKEKEKTKDNLQKSFDTNIKIINKEKQFMEFLKKNIAPAILIASVPMILEEAMASGRAIKNAKGIASKAEMGKLKKVYGLALSTYIISAGLTAIAAKYACSIWDKVKRPDKETKVKNK